MNDFCSQKGIKKEISNARTPQQNGVTERRNRTLIEAARTMLADAKLPDCMENPEQAFVDYVSSRTDEAGADFKQQQGEMTNKIDTVLKAITDRIADMLPSDTVTNISLIDKNKAECTIPSTRLEKHEKEKLKAYSFLMGQQ
nr:putative ribonuclease H-like domain-containing protein [Tanacetum cinerariifolium]